MFRFRRDWRDAVLGVNRAVWLCHMSDSQRRNAPVQCRLKWDIGSFCIPKGPHVLRKRRVLRGGSWNNNPANLRAANRNRNTPDNRNNNIGFRVSSTTYGQSRLHSVQTGVHVVSPGAWGESSKGPRFVPAREGGGCFSRP